MLCHYPLPEISYLLGLYRRRARRKAELAWLLPRTPDRPCRPKASRLDERGKALEQFSRRLADDLLWQDRSGKGAATTQAAAPY
jgi:hypothetical protein